jgi:hypothetical protein
MAILRFIVLQTILAAALIALWLAGPLAQALAGDSHWYVLAVAAIGCTGLVLAALGRIEDATRVRDLLPVIGVVAMQCGIVVALAAMAQALMTAGDPAKATGGFFGALSIALYVSITALASYIWLTLTIWLTGGEDA